MAEGSQQRGLTIAAASAALLATQLVDPLLEEALGDLVMEEYSPGMQSAVAALREWLDEQAWDAQASAEVGRSVEPGYEAWRIALSNQLPDRTVTVGPSGSVLTAFSSTTK
jgi:hypothetical protein